MDIPGPTMKRANPAALAAIAFMVCACSGSTGGNHETEKPLVDVAVPAVDSVVLRKTYPGVLSANREVDVVARVDGYIQSKNYVSGDRVPQGAVLFRIEDSQYRDAVEQARAALATARSQHEYATAHYQALRQALKSDAVSRMEAEQGRSAMETSEAAVASAQAELNTALTQLGYCTVRAPFTGRITSGIQDVGAYVGGAAQPVSLAKIFDDAVMVANFAVEDASLLPVIRQRMGNTGMDFSSIPVSFSDTLSRGYTAAMDYLAPVVDTSTGTVSIQAVIDNPDGELRSGMFVSVDLPCGCNPHAMLVRQSAVGRDQRGSYLYVVNDSDKVEYRHVTLGHAVGDSMYIVSEGIAPTDRYVTRAMIKVRPGMEVQPNPTR